MYVHFAVLRFDKLVIVIWTGCSTYRVKLNAVTTLLMYDEIHKVHRKTLHSYIGTRAACKVHESMEEIETRRFLWRMLVNPDEFMHNIRS